MTTHRPPRFRRHPEQQRSSRQILNKNYSAAQKILNNVTPDATTYYLKAVVGARTNNEAEVTTNLRKAISLDPNMAAQAASDLEFSAFNLSNL